MDAMPQCTPNTLFGRAGEGVHAARIPGTNAAAVDYVLTLLAAWGISAAFKWDLVRVTVAVFVLAMAAHHWFCIK